MSRPAYSTSVLVEASTTECGISSIFKTIAVLTTATDLMVSGTPLVGRTGLMIQADSDNTLPIYIGVNGNPTLTNAMYRLDGGAGVIIALDKYNQIPIKAIASAIGQKIHICEIK